MSYLTIKRLQYGGSQAQESRDARPHIPGADVDDWGQPDLPAGFRVLTVGGVELKYRNRAAR